MTLTAPEALKLIERMKRVRTDADVESVIAEFKRPAAPTREAMSAQDRHAFYEREAFRRIGAITPEQQREARQQSLERAFRGMGLSESGAKIAAAGRDGSRVMDLTERRRVQPSNGPALPAAGGPSEESTKSAEDKLKSAFAAMGLSEAEASIAAAGRF